MKTKTSKRNVTRVASLTSAMAILGSGAVLPFADAQQAAGAETGEDIYAVNTTTADGKQEFPGDNGSGWNLVGNACLTPGASGNGESCGTSVGWNGDPEHGKGWIQLTDASMGTDPNGPKGTENTFKNGENIGPSSNANQRGSALYNTNIPAARGLDIQFEQVQGGGSTRRFWSFDYETNKWTYILDPTRGADGIGFYLVDGDKTTSLTKPGAYGAGLGYTQGTADARDKAEIGKNIDRRKNAEWDNPDNILRDSDRIANDDSAIAEAVSGVDNGVLGVGLDSFGNFASKKYGLGYTETDKYKVPGSSAGYSWEQVALATATDASGKPACVRDIHPGNKPLDLSILGGLGETLSGLLNTDCTSKGLIDVKRKSSQFGEILYKTDFDPMPFRRIVADDENSPLRFRGVDKDGNAGISYWEPRGDALSLRGPGHGIDGYQLLASRGYTGAPQDQGSLSETLGAKSFRAQPTSSTPSEQAFNLHPSTTHYKYVRVTIDPKTDEDSNVRVTVAASNEKGKFPTGPGANTAFLEASIPSQFIPENYKFGFSASTGAGTDVHAIRDVRIKGLKGGLELKKSVSIAGGKKVAAKGDTLNYKFVVKNSGEAPLQKVNVADPIVSGIDCGGKDTLAVGESITCTGDHVVTDEDLANSAKQKFGKTQAQGIYDKIAGGATLTTTPEFESGFIEKEKFVNKAVAYGLNGDNDGENGGMVFSNVDRAEVPVGTPTPAPKPKDPKITLTKNVKGGKTSGYKEGDTVEYEFVVKNASEEPLVDVKFTDDQAKTADGKNITQCDAEELEVGGSTTCTGVHELQPGEFKDGKFINTATVTGKGKTTGKDVNAKDTATVTPALDDPERGLKLEKVVNEESDLAKDKYVAGDKVPYKFTVTNVGEVDLTNIVIDDEALDAPATCEATDLAVDASTTCEGVHTLTEDEVAQPEFVNIAQAIGEDPNKPEDDPERKVPSNKDEAVVEFPTEALGLVKEVDAKSELAKSVYAAGDKVPYLFTVTNEGNVKIDNIAIEDKALDAPATCDDSSLEGGDSTECRGVHTLTEEEAAAGQFRNVATATGTNPNGDPVHSPEDDEIVPVEKNELILDKRVDEGSDLAKETYQAGDKVPYLFNVKNNGPVEIHDLVVVDGAIEGDAVCESTTLAPGAETDCRGVHTLTEAEAAKGEFLNVAYASGLDPNGNPVNSNEDQEIVPTDVPRGPLASTGASVKGLLGLGVLTGLVGAGVMVIRRRNV